MVDPSSTEYARSADAYVAYRECGHGPVDLLLITDWFGHADQMWAPGSPFLALLEPLASFSRVITFDQRGVGLSDPVPLDHLPTLEEWMQDLNAVLDASEATKVTLVAKGAGGAMGLLYAASHPERLSSLVLVNSYARLLAADDYPHGVRPERVDGLLRTIYPAPGFAGRLAGGTLDDATVAWFDRYLRLSASPSTTLAMRRMLFAVDVRAVLSAIHTPTLVLHRKADDWIHVEHGRYLAEHIPDARLVELPGGSDLIFAGDVAELVAEVQEFVTGARPAAPSHRVLATVLFTDLVQSTQRAASVGDRAWSSTLDRHEHLVRQELQRFNGREINTVGDGFLAIFDGPARAIQCAAAIRRALAAIGLEVRAGLHTGEIELRGDDISGIGVHIAARISALARAHEILVSRTVKDLVAGSGIVFDDHGVRELKGVPDAWHLYAARVD